MEKLEQDRESDADEGPELGVALGRAEVDEEGGGKLAEPGDGGRCAGFDRGRLLDGAAGVLMGSSQKSGVRWLK